MNKIIKHISLILFVVISITRQSTYAQAANNYPVDVTPILTPPYKLNIAEYASNSAFLKLQLRLKDLTKSSVDVYFKMQISTIGISIRTRDDFKPLKTEKLFPGELKTLTGPDLAEYFRPENLIVDGLDPAILYAGGKLPSGLYTFTFTAYETDRDRQVSNVGSALMTVFLGLPPLITSPQQDQLLTPIDPQAVLFQWLPRATASPTGFSSTVYQIRLFRIDPNNAAQTSLFVEANQTALSQDPIFVGQSNSPNFLYNPLQPAYFPLIPGEVYAIQVQATNPIANENTYENNGYSQVVSFRYGAKCLPPTAFTTSLKDLGIVTLSWQVAEAAQSYDVRYRLSGTSLWQSKSIYGNSITLPFLADGNYEYQLLSNCGVGTQSSWGESQSFTLSNGLLIENKAVAARENAATTLSQTNSTSSTSQSSDANDLLDRVMNPLANPVSSGPALSSADIDSFFEKVPRPKCAGVADKTVSCDVNITSYTGIPKDRLEIGSKIVINNYEVVLSEVTGGNGTFSGRGVAQFPFLAVRFPVVFSNISVVGAPEGIEPLTQEQGGCVSAGEIVVEGSDAGLLDRDVQTRLQNLYNRANNPNAFSGNFKEAIEAAKKMAQELLDKIAKGETPTAEEIGKYKSICKALNAGMEAWKQDIKNQFPAPRAPEIDQILTNLESYNAQLQDLLNCNGQGYLKYGRNSNDLYASLKETEPGFYFVACNYLAGKEVALSLESDICNISKTTNKGWIESYKSNILYQTDGHYATVYLVALMLGIGDAEKIATYSEYPDNIINSETTRSELRTTWGNSDFQQKYHSLTNGFFSDEEFATAIALLNMPIDTEENIKKFGFMIHRYGDVYAHVRIEDRLKDSDLQKMYGKHAELSTSLPETIMWILGGTAEHTNVDGINIGEAPDMIKNDIKRYINYVKNLSEILSIRYFNKVRAIDFSIFENMAKYAKDNDISLMGIIQFEIARIKGKSEFVLPYPYLASHSSDDMNYISHNIVGNIALTAERDKYEKWVKNTENYINKLGLIATVERHTEYQLCGTEELKQYLYEAKFKW